MCMSLTLASVLFADIASGYHNSSLYLGVSAVPFRASSWKYEDLSERVG